MDIIRIWFSIAMTVMLIGCSESTKLDAPETSSDSLNELVRSAPYQYVNLDDPEVREISLLKDDIIYSIYEEEAESEPLLGRMIGITFLKDQFYVYDASAKAIFTVGLNGDVNGPFTREGRGPGEHNTIGYLHANTSYIYNADINNARINRYDKDLEPVEPMQEFTSTSEHIALNDSILLMENRYSSGFSPVSPDEGLITITPVGNFQDTLATILPRIIPVGYQPQVYNNPQFSVNNSGEIAASYHPLPWMFLFDADYNHQKTLILEYSVFEEEMDIPEMKIFKPKGNRGYGGSMPFRRVKLLNNGDLFLSISNELIHLSQSENGEYSAAKYRMLHSSAEDTLWISHIFSAGTKNEFYAGNWEYLFEVDLSDEY